MSLLHHAVTLDPTSPEPGPLTALATIAAPRGVDDSLAVAAVLGRLVLDRTGGDLLDRWQALATLAALDVAAARVVEPHLDALTMLQDAHHDTIEGVDIGALSWGVFAAEGGDEPLTATAGLDGAYTLTGVKPWCSLAGRLDAALVTAHLDGSDERGLFAVRLGEGVQSDDTLWAARGLREIPSGPVRFTAVEAVLIGEPGWYLRRPGFSWGGVGVAACWFGGAVGIARAVHAAAMTSEDAHVLAHLGAIDELLHSARRSLAEAAAIAEGDSTERDGPDARLTAKRVRATVARASDEIIDRAHRALGPAPLVLDDAHAKRVADLQLYVRQHHAERDQASLGLALAGSAAPW